MTGLSRANLHHMRRFADAWPVESAEAIVQQPVRQLPWEMQPALPDLPALASELSDIIEAANAVNEDQATEKQERFQPA